MTTEPLIAAEQAFTATLTFYPFPPRRRAPRTWAKPTRRRKKANNRRHRERQRRLRLHVAYPHQFRCAACLRVFNKGRSDGEAAAEALERFGMTDPPGEGALVCEPCFLARNQGWTKDARAISAFNPFSFGFVMTGVRPAAWFDAVNTMEK